MFAEQSVVYIVMGVFKNKKFYIAVITLVSVFLSLYAFVDTSPAQRTLSNIGLYYPRFFITWGLFAGISVFLNLHLLAEKLKFKSKIFNIMTCGSFAVFLTVFINGPAQWQVIIHWSSGMTFGILSFLCTMALFWIKFCKCRSYFPYMTLCLLAAVFTVATIYFLGLTALCQIVILIVCQLCLLTANVIERKSYNVANAGGNVEAVGVD